MTLKGSAAYYVCLCTCHVCLVVAYPGIDDNGLSLVAYLGIDDNGLSLVAYLGIE